MDNLNENEIKTLRRMSSILNGGELTKKEFLDAFQNGFYYLTCIHNTNLGILKFLKKTLVKFWKQGKSSV